MLESTIKKTGRNRKARRVANKNCKMNMKVSEQNLEQIKGLIKSKYRKNLILGIILILLGTAGVFFGEATGGGDKGIYFFAGIIGGVGGLVIVLLSLRNPSKHKLVIWLSTCPTEIVWMYEVSGKQNGVRLLKENGEHVFLEITGPNKESWLNFLHQLLPQAHFGYDEVGKSLINKK